MQADNRAGPIVFVIFAGVGDLAWRKLIPALYDLFLDARLPARFKVLGTGRSWTLPTFLQCREDLATCRVAGEPLE